MSPSYKFLAKDLVAQLKKKTSSGQCDALNILEIGPGTGPLTKQIIEHIRPQDRLDIVEIHEKFYQIVKERYQKPNIQTYHTDILNFQSDYRSEERRVGKECRYG